MREETGKSELEAIRDWYAYNTFVRRRYLRFLQRLPKGVITKGKEASFPSILEIFTHVLDVYKSTLKGFYETGKDTELLEHISLKEMMQEEEEMDAYLSGLMQRLTPFDLESPFVYSYGQGKIKRKRRGILVDVLWHLVEEELQHLGEINALLFQENIDPPVTSWLYWKKHQSNAVRTNT